jgi:two-component system response regulator MprA
MSPEPGARSTQARDQRGPILIVEDGERTVEVLARLEQRASYAVAVSGAKRNWQQNLRLLARLLEDDGFRVEIAVGVADARQRIRSMPPLVALVTDVSLPSPDAVETALEARQLVAGLPLFFVTSYPCLLETRDLDPPPYLFTKPLDYRAFLLELRRETRSRSGQISRVKIDSGADAQLAVGAERDSWPG